MFAVAISVSAKETKDKVVAKKDSVTTTVDKSGTKCHVECFGCQCSSGNTDWFTPSTFVNVYENGMPAVYSSVIYNVSSNWRSESSLASLGLMDP